MDNPGEMLLNVGNIIHFAHLIRREKRPVKNPAKELPL